MSIIDKKEATSSIVDQQSESGISLQNSVPCNNKSEQSTPHDQKDKKPPGLQIKSKRIYKKKLSQPKQHVKNPLNDSDMQAEESNVEGSAIADMGTDTQDMEANIDRDIGVSSSVADEEFQEM